MVCFPRWSVQIRLATCKHSMTRSSEITWGMPKNGCRRQLYAFPTTIKKTHCLLDLMRKGLISWTVVLQQIRVIDQNDPLWLRHPVTVENLLTMQIKLLVITTKSGKLKKLLKRQSNPQSRTLGGFRWWNILIRHGTPSFHWFIRFDRNRNVWIYGWIRLVLGSTLSAQLE